MVGVDGGPSRAARPCNVVIGRRRPSAAHRALASHCAPMPPARHDWPCPKLPTASVVFVLHHTSIHPTINSGSTGGGPGLCWKELLELQELQSMQISISSHLTSPQHCCGPKTHTHTHTHPLPGSLGHKHPKWKRPECGERQTHRPGSFSLILVTFVLTRQFACAFIPPLQSP